MRKLSVFIILVIIVGCKEKRPQPNFFKDLYTGKIFSSQSEVRNYLKNNVLPKDKDSLQKVYFSIEYHDVIQRQDSIILNFKYILRYDGKYLIRPHKYSKIGMKIEPQTLTSIYGKKVVIGGKQEKPMFVNLWFIGCGGCESEIPDLNQLKEKYADKVNFVALASSPKRKVLRFLKRKKFNFTHITDADDFIYKIGSHPYPESIFIDRNGRITHIESLINDEPTQKYFESILDKLIKKDSIRVQNQDTILKNEQ